MPVQMTPENCPKFTKRLHKAIKEIFGDSVTLSQSAELLARAAGFKTLHDLQAHLKEKSAPLPLSSPSTKNNAEEHAWIQHIEEQITTYAHNHPESSVQQWCWVVSFNKYCLQIRGKTNGFGLFFQNFVNKHVDKSCQILDGVTASDIDFITHLAGQFPTDYVQQSTLSAVVQQSVFGTLLDSPDTHHLIAQNPSSTNFVHHQRLGRTREDFIVLRSGFVTPFVFEEKKWVDVAHLTPVQSFERIEAAIQSAQNTPDSVLMQRLTSVDNPQHQISSFQGLPNAFGVEMRSVNNDPRVLTVRTQYDLIRFKGLLAGIHGVVDNPYAINQQERVLWDDGLNFSKSFPARARFWVKPRK